MAWACHFCPKEYRWDTGLMRHLKEKHLEETKKEAEAYQDTLTANPIRTLRLEAGLTQARLASLLGVSTNTVARWERGVITPPPYVEAAIKHVLSARRRGKPRA